MFVRLALESEEDQIVEMSRQAVAESVPHVEFSADRARETFRAYLADAHPTFFVVERRRELVGFLMATISPFRFADGLYTTQEVIFVQPDHRGSRAAALLMKHLVAWSKQLGAVEITGGNDNSLHSDRMRRFMERFGFEQVGVFMRRVF